MNDAKGINIFRRLLNIKLFFLIILVVAIFEGVIIKSMSNPVNNFLLPPYSFYDSGDLVTAQGSFLSTTYLANPVQTSYIRCWKDFNTCWIAESTVSDNNFLSTNLDVQDIRYWNDDFIETEPYTPLAGCVEESYRIDRRSKTVNYTRRTLVSKEELCKGVQKEPITATLGDGLKRLEIYKKGDAK